MRNNFIHIYEGGKKSQNEIMFRPAENVLLAPTALHWLLHSLPLVHLIKASLLRLIYLFLFCVC